MKNEIPQDLFREAAVRHAIAKRETGVGFLPILPVRILLCVACLLVCAMGALLFFGKYSRNLNVTGVVEPNGGLTEIRAPMAGTVAQVYAEEGAMLQKQGFILRLTARATDRAGKPVGLDVLRLLEVKAARLEERLAQENGSQLQQEKNLLEQQRLIRAEVRGLEEEIQLQAARTRLADKSVDVYTDLKGIGFVSELGIAPHLDRKLELSSSQSALVRALSNLRREEIRLQQSLAEIRQQTQQKISELRKELDDIALEKIRVGSDTERTLVAAAPGRLLRRLVKADAMVESGQLLAVLSPEPGRFIARFAVPSESIAEVGVGQPAQLSIPGYPTDRYGFLHGKVVAISRAGISAADTRIAGGVGTQNQNALFQMDIGIDEQQLAKRNIPVRTGMRIQAEVQLRRQPLYQRLIAPFTVGLQKQFQ